MILTADFKSLEWVTYLDLSKDKTGIEEWISGIDIHSKNQKDINLPERLIAKKFLFRWIYLGSAYAYSKDKDFNYISKSVTYWQNIIDSFNSKYYGIATTHNKLIDDVIKGNPIISPLGRKYKYKPYRDKNNELQWPKTKIVNHINQGYGSDLVAIFRTILNKEWKANKLKGKLINTIHDSIVTDIPKEEFTIAQKLIIDAVDNVPKIVYDTFSYELSVPLKVELSYGPNQKELTECK